MAELAPLGSQSNATLLVGDSGCTYIEICEILMTSSGGVPPTKLLEISRRLGLPNDFISMINPWLLTGIKTNHSILYEMIEAWRGKESTNATLFTLLKVLKDSELHGCSDALKAYFHIEENEIPRAKLPNCKVTFQDSVMPIAEALSGLSQDFNEKYLSYGNTSEPLVSNSVPRALKYYIPRRISKRSHLDPSLFAYYCKDVFVVKNIQLHEFSLLAGSHSTDVSSNQIFGLTVRFILLEHEDDFEEICKFSTGDPIHLIDYNGCKLTWVKTHGNKLSSLHKFIYGEQEQLIEEDFTELCLSSRQPICISDTPGMGKTSLLSSIAHHIMKKYPSRLVQFIVLREFVQKLEHAKLNDVNFCINLLAEHLANSDFGKEIVIQLQNSQSEIVELMFDGFDEVLSNQVETAKLVLRQFSSIKSVRLYVTTRPHMREELENTLGVLGFNMQGFERKEQIDFLTKYWEYQCGAGNNGRLNDFAKACLESLTENINDFEQEFAGIPLQCFLIAEVYKSQALRYSSEEKWLTNFGKGVTIRITSIFEMYQRLMELRFEKIVENKKLYINAHIYSAVQLLFPEHSHISEEEKMESEDLYSFGILEKKNTNSETPRFVHRSFAEFFVGMFIAQTLVAEDPKYNFFLSVALQTEQSRHHFFISSKIGKCKPIESANFRFPVLCYFVDAQVKLYQSEIIKGVTWAYERKMLYGMLAACITHNYANLYQQLLKPDIHKQEIEQEQHLINLLYLSVKNGNLELFSLVHQHNMKFSERLSLIASSSPKFQITPLHIAVELGHYRIVEYLLKFQNTTKLKYIYHCCVAGSGADSEDIISYKIQILKLLQKLGREMINESMPDGTTPLLCFNVHLKLRQSLVTLGADVNEVINSKTVLHVVAQSKINAETYHDFLMSLLAHGFKGINSLDSRKQTPLHVTLQHIELLESTFNIFRKKQANFNAVDKYEDSLLFHAVRHGMSVSIIKILEVNGADIKHTNVKNENVLHVAAKYGNIQALEHFLRSPKIMTEVTASNNWWSIDTPFMQAMKNGNCISVHTIQLMESKGLVIGTEVASKALTYFFRSKKLVTKGLEKAFVETADYLLKRGARYESNAWKLEPTKRILGRVKQITQCNSSLLAELRKRDVLSDDDRISLLGKSDELYQKLETLQEKNSFEKLLISLIACNQITPFRLLKQCLQMYLSGSATFSTPHRDFVQFIESEQENLLGLRSWDLELTIQRLKDTIDPGIFLANEKDLVDELQDEKLVIFQPETAVPPKDVVELLKTNKTKGVILSSGVDEFAEYKILRDDFSWSDLSSNCQKKIESKFLVKIGSTLHKLANSSFQFSSLKNGFLAAIIRYQVAEFRGFEGKINENQYISNSIFNYFLSDKLLFHGITQSDLQKFSKFGHTIGGLGGQLENLNYIIVESEDQFKQVCSKSTESVHLIQFVKNEARFKLLRTRGSTTKIQMFIENENCREFPTCNCNHDSSNLTICFSFTDTKNKREQLVSVDPNEVPIQLLNLTGLQDSLELSEIKKSFTEWFHSNKDVFNSSTALQTDSNFPNLETKTNQICEIVYKWLQLLNCTATEMAKLRQLAVTTLFPNLIQNPNSHGMYKFFEMGLLKRKFGTFVLVHDALAWCVIAEMVLSSETVSFVTLSELRNILFKDCFEQPCAIFIPYNMTPDEIYYSEKISFFTFKNSRIFDFIELHLSKSNITSVLTNHLTALRMEKDTFKKWIYSCVVANCFNLLKIVASLNVHHDLFASQELLIIAIKYASVPIIQFVVDEFVKHTERSVPNIQLYFETKNQFSNYTFTEILSILHIAVLRGEKSIVDFLIDNYNLTDFLNHADNLDLLNFCVVDTNHMPKLQIEERKQVINLLLRKNPRLMREKRHCRPNALLVPKIHIELILHLINLGIDIHDSYQLSENILHKCPNYLDAQEYDMLVQLLHAIEKTSIFHTTDVFQRTPLHRAVEKLELVKSTLQTFSSSKADFNSTDKYGNTLLVFAVKNVRSAGLFESLIRHGADVFKTDNINRNIIHLAARYGDQTAVRYFLSLGFHVNATDDYNYTPLHEALNFSHNHTHEKVTALVERGADINAANGLLETPLSLAVEGNERGRVQCRTVEFLKSAGGQVIEPNEFAVTNFHSTLGDYD